MKDDKTITVAFSIPESMKDELDRLANSSNGIIRSRSHALAIVFQEWKQSKKLSKKTPSQAYGVIQ